MQAPSLESVIEAARSFLPRPPLVPPTPQNIDNNHDATEENLSEINRGLQRTLADQKGELGRLRGRIDELEGELRREEKERTEREDVEKGELEAEKAELEAEYMQQLAEAWETIAKLEERGGVAEEELRNGKARLEEVLEAKERVAAEYSYVVNSYAKLKGSVESQTSDWSAKLDASRGEVAALEAQLANATFKMDLYQTESGSWKEECTNKANQLDSFTERVRNMQGTIDNLQTGMKDTQNNLDRIISNAKSEEKERNKANLQTLSDEYEVLMSEKSRNIGNLRKELREANARRRHAEKYAEKEKSAAVEETRAELTVEIDRLKGALEEKEEEVRDMQDSAKEAEGLKEERERLMAEIMFLSKSFEGLQAELEANAQSYEDCISSFEKEASEKDKRIKDLEIELMLANEKISQLEIQIEGLTAELEEERTVNANLTATVSELRDELDLSRSNSRGYDDIVAILRREAEAYKSQLAEAQEGSGSFERRANELEELVKKTKDTLVGEKKRVVNALEEKDTRIARLDRELAEKFDAVRTAEASLEKTNSRLTKMTNKYNGEKNRADALDRKIQKLNLLAANNAEEDRSSEEVDRLTLLLEELSKSNDEYKSLMNTYEEKVKFISQQLLLSSQNVYKKQSQIESLRQELSDATSRASTKAETRKTTGDEASVLRSKLDEVQSKSTVWKAQANGMIVQMTSDLKEKDASMLKLQNKLDELSQEQERQTSTKSDNNALEEEIADLKAAMEESHAKAKEKMMHKNRSLKDMEDTVATLTAEMEDLKREKNLLADRLDNVIKHGTNDFQIHERQLHQTEDRLAKEHMAAMAEIENEMTDTIRGLEMEIRSLTEKLADADSAPQQQQGTATVKGANNEYLKLQGVEEALRRSKEKEVSLINQNMKMQHTIQDLQKRAQEHPASVAASVFDDELAGGGDEEDGLAEVELPTYYTERQKPVVIRFVGNAWRKIFRRKKL